MTGSKEQKPPEERGGGVFLHPLATDDQLQTLALDDDDDDISNSKSYSSYRNAMSPLSSSSVSDNPLVPAPSDPLLFASQALDSPSYAAMMVTAFQDGIPESNGDNSLSEVPNSPHGSQSSDAEYLRISVSDPQKEVESSNSIVPGRASYVSYLITTTTNFVDFGGSSFTVRRRFRDIVTLSDRLSESYRGFFIPLRPDKSVVERQVMQSQEFVEQRRVELEKFLRRLSRHPVLRESDELRVFLTVQGRMPLPTSIDVASRVLDGAVRLPKQLLGESTSVIEPQDVVHPAKSGRNMLRFFRELKQSVVNDWGTTKPSVEEEDKEFLEKKAKLIELEQQLTNASKQAESLVKAQQDMGETMGELGLAFVKLTRFENEQAVMNAQGVRASDMKALATSAVKVSRLFRELNSKTVKHFEILHEYMGLMLAIHSAFSDRSNALLTVQTLISDLSSLHSRVEKLKHAASSKISSADKSRIRKLEDLKDAIRATEGAKSCAIQEYQRIKENNRSEMQRLSEERKADFLNMLKGFVVNQVAYSERIGAEWMKVAEETSKYAQQR